MQVSAEVFADGHERLRAVVRYRRVGDADWQEAPLAPIGYGVRWAGEFPLDRTGSWEFTVAAWTDVYDTWCDELERKLEAGQTDLEGERSEGELLLGVAAARADASDRQPIVSALAVLRDGNTPPTLTGLSAAGDGERGSAGAATDGLGGLDRERTGSAAAPAQPNAGRGESERERDYAAVLDQKVRDAVDRATERRGLVTLEPPLALEVDRVRARFSSWYELFPRSWGGLRGVRDRLPEFAQLGFDVLYMTPIHPIGVTNRKGKNNALVAGPGDPGSPYAVGSADGGHDAVDPGIGTVQDVRDLCAAAAGLGIDIALDIAINASADHPWLTEHPDWFHHRPDGTLKYAENPPKRYQDIYNVNWESDDWGGLWSEWLRVFLFWVDCGVKVFRVDNPHTKPFAFWEWLIAQVHAVDRDVIFLAEAFTKRAVMRHLAKLGFSQSYTYFTWKNSGAELLEYVDDLATGAESEYFRPNFFTNTPDILNGYLVDGGEPAFHTRLVLAATLSPSYSIYSGYENFENTPVKEGSEEYLNSEKYEIWERTLDGPMLPFIAKINQIRRANPALQRLSNITWLDAQNDALLAYYKREGNNVIICVVNLDPHHTTEGGVVIAAALGLPPSFTVTDELTGERYDWRIGQNYVRLDPPSRQAHILLVEL